jgi:hypothetical protein
VYPTFFASFIFIYLSNFAFGHSNLLSVCVFFRSRSSEDVLAKDLQRKAATRIYQINIIADIKVVVEQEKPRKKTKILFEDFFLRTEHSRRLHAGQQLL